MLCVKKWSDHKILLILQYTTGVNVFRFFMMSAVSPKDSSPVWIISAEIEKHPSGNSTLPNKGAQTDEEKNFHFMQATIVRHLQDAGISKEIGKCSKIMYQLI